MDGGINLETARIAVEAGANMLVMGTAYFRAEHPDQVVRTIREL